MSGTQKDLDGFEGGLGDALRRTGEGFSAEGRPLVDGGVVRGRRGLRRRRIAAVTGSVAALAVVGFGASYTAGAFGGGSGHDSAGVAAQPKARKGGPSTESASVKGPQLSAQRVIGTLEGLLPKGKVSERQGRGTADRLGPLAQLVFDDGGGKAAIAVSVGAIDPKGTEAEQQLECPDKTFIPYDSCRNETLADGSRLMVLRGYEYPDKRVDTKRWQAFLVTADGYTVDASEWNAPSEKDAAVSRAEPPLSVGQLKGLVTSAKWRPVMNALEKAAPEPVRQPAAQGQDGKAILKKLRLLLPPSVSAVSGHGDDGYAYVVVNDGKGASLVQINVQPHMSDVAGELFGSGAEVLPDGTKVVTQQGPGEKGGAGVVMWTADTIRKDGLRVVVSEFNSGSQNAKATRETPALTMQQLKAIAMSGKWAEK
ncbi:hypothetical protein [Streptomyces sp. ITFR-16]|uniref:hypothetical protein n=1 Tax=Streptomyces sp. ITFR-16 TaxID=3075198 RepID=UPI00288BDA36|nr:hypothetical protein [Streptomyces sp. ITFR-16]WNI23662.1 hypothetical protein RLT58_17820 [Streptomyces sp. ITFR-16]